MNSSTSFPKNGIGKKTLADSHHGTKILPRPVEFRTRSLTSRISISLNEAATGMPIEVFIGKNREATHGWSICRF